VIALTFSILNELRYSGALRRLVGKIVINSSTSTFSAPEIKTVRLSMRKMEGGHDNGD
jgi:hypothetical protein